MTVENAYDFTDMHSAIEKYVDDNLLAGASSVVLKYNPPVVFSRLVYAAAAK